MGSVASAGTAFGLVAMNLGSCLAKDRQEVALMALVAPTSAVMGLGDHTTTNVPGSLAASLITPNGGGIRFCISQWRFGEFESRSKPMAGSAATLR